MVSPGGPPAGPMSHKQQPNNALSWPHTLLSVSSASVGRPIRGRKGEWQHFSMVFGFPQFEPISCSNHDGNYCSPYTWVQLVWSALQGADLRHSVVGQVSGSPINIRALQTTNSSYSSDAPLITWLDWVVLVRLPNTAQGSRLLVARGTRVTAKDSWFILPSSSRKKKGKKGRRDGGREEPRPCGVQDTQI